MSLDVTALAEFARARMPGALFVTVSGAHLYGFPSEDSDVDLRGAYLLPLPDLVGLRKPEETRQVEADLAGREVDLVGHEAGKYLRLLCKNNGYILEQVFSPLVVLGQDFLDRLRPLARACVTRGCHHHYRGFLHQQLKMFEREPVKKAKTLLYAYRVVLTGIHLLETGEVQADLTRLNERFGLAFLDDLIVRKQRKERGTLSDLNADWHRAELSRWETRLADAYQCSKLPDAAPREQVHQFLLDLRFHP